MQGQEHWWGRGAVLLLIALWDGKESFAFQKSQLQF